MVRFGQTIVSGGRITEKPAGREMQPGRNAVFRKVCRLLQEQANRAGSCTGSPRMNVAGAIPAEPGSLYFISGTIISLYRKTEGSPSTGLRKNPAVLAEPGSLLPIPRSYQPNQPFSVRVPLSAGCEVYRPYPWRVPSRWFAPPAVIVLGGAGACQNTTPVP